MNDSSIQVPPALYMAKRQLSGSGDIMGHLNLANSTWLYERPLREHCSAECVDGHVILQQ